ncbi:Sec1 domain-containing protein 2 [Rhizophlyctis rosea]|uniref:Sec1 domain-containing protein 2 n=1 Tax=Rhizophlyctis rosea TaxID=64517 RepID=A0AAD5S8C1_9FUNG|nr:Sec1 domain-containing protein 2 [Rhizophlyctis rosea]
MDLQPLHKKAWATVLKLLSGAVLYTDDATLSVLKWSVKGGLPSLFSNGLHNIKLLGHPSPDNDGKISLPDSSKIIVLLSCHIANHAEAIRDLILHSHYTECHIITALSEDAHVVALASDPSLIGVFGEQSGDGMVGYFRRVEGGVYRWLEETLNYAQPGQGIVVSVQHQPLICSLFTNDLFLIPSRVFPSLKVSDGGLPRSPSDEFHNSRTPVPAESGITQLAASISSLLDSLGARDELFAVGETSRQLAKSITTQSSSSPRRHAERNVGVIFIDRSLDLVAPTMHSDNLLDQIYTALPRVTENSLDLEVDSGLLLADAEAEFVPCSLAHGWDDESVDLLIVLTMLSQKDSLVVIRKRLVDLISKEPSIDFKPPRVLGKVTLSQLQTFLSPFRGNEQVLMRRAAVLQCIAGAVQTLTECGKLHWDELTSVEKIMILSLSETLDPGIVVQQVKDVLSRVGGAAKGSDSSTFTIHDVILLMAFAFSLIGTTLRMSPADESGLRESVYQALVRIVKKEGHEAKLDDPSYRSVLQTWVNETFGTLGGVRGARSGLHQYGKILHPTSPTPYQGIIKQILTRALESDRVPGIGEVEDLVHVPYGGTLGGVLSGFSRFLGARAHPSQFQNLIVFVVGGVTFREVREIREIAREKGVKILVGSTDIATGASVFRHLFVEPPV